MTKRLTCALLCLLLLTTAFPTASMAKLPAPTFEDGTAVADALDAIQYDKDFAGLYFSNNRTSVTVMLVNASSARKNQIRAMVARPDILLFKNAKYTFAELDKICGEAMVISDKAGFCVTDCAIYDRENYVEIGVYYDGVEAARKYFAKFKDAVKVVGSDYDIAGTGFDKRTFSNEQWIRQIFPDAKEYSTEKVRFVFSGAPRAVKTRAVLNKQSESLTLYRFDNKQDYDRAKTMIRGNTVVSGSAVVYVDTLFASTYFYDDESNLLALYCGSTQTVFSVLVATDFNPAGGLGGFFSWRNAIYKTAAQRIEPNGKTPASPKALRAASTAVLTGTVKSVPTTKDTSGVYTIAVTDSIRGSLKGTINVTAMPGVLEKGRSYVLFLKKDAKSIYRLTDEAYFSAFELSDKGYVLPIREYGMTKLVTLDAFQKSL